MWYYSHDPYEIVIFGQLWREHCNRNQETKDIFMNSFQSYGPKTYFAKKAKVKSFTPPNTDDELWPGPPGARGGSCESYTELQNPGSIYSGQDIDHHVTGANPHHNKTNERGQNNYGKEEGELLSETAGSFR